MFKKSPRKQKGFTLIELLIVIAIIGLLASVVLVALSSARTKSRIAKRVGDLRQMATALELFYAANNAYPATAGSGWQSQCNGWGSYAASNVVPGLVPTYMGSFPADPLMNVAASNSNCYVYESNGTDYKFIDYWISDLTAAQVLSLFQSFADPERNGTNQTICPGGNDPAVTLAIWSPGAKCW